MVGIIAETLSGALLGRPGNRAKGGLALAAMCLACAREGAGPGRREKPRELILADFEGSTEGFRSEERVVFSLSSKKGVARGRQALEVPLPASDYPGIYKELDEPDWSGYDCLRLDAFNPTMRKLAFCVRVDDAESRGYSTRFNKDTGLFLHPGENPIEIPLAQMARGGVSQRGIDLERLSSIHFFLARPRRPVKLALDALRLVRFARPAERSKEMLVTGGGRNWKASEGTRAEETENGVSFSPRGGRWPGVRITGPWALYGWDVIELGYRTDPAWHAVSVKLVTSDGEKTTLSTGVRGEGVARLPVFLASDVPLGDVAELSLFFSEGDCPKEFELLFARLYGLPEGRDTREPAEGTSLVADFTALSDVGRNTAFAAWLWLPQGGGGGREVVKTSYERALHAQNFTRLSLRGMRVRRPRKKGKKKEELDFVARHAPEVLLGSDAALLTGYFLDHGVWHFATEEVRLAEGEESVVNFEPAEMGR